MPPTRRQFIQQFGVMLASLIAARCAPTSTPAAAPTATPTLTPTPTIVPPGSGDASLRGRLRDYWLQLDWITQQAQESYGQGTARDGFVAGHRTILDELVAAGELDAGVAEQVQIAFAAAAYSAWFAGYRRVYICYTPTPSPMPSHTPEPYETIGHALADYTFSSAYQLKNQADLLAEMVASDDLSPDVVAQAQAALERDITFLSTFYAATRAGLERVIAPSHLSNEETWTLYEELEHAVDGPYSFPNFDELELDVPAEAAEAARFLVELLLEE